jgi:thiol-disulfide isomerase/thioredoxin
MVGQGLDVLQKVIFCLFLGFFTKNSEIHLLNVGWDCIILGKFPDLMHLLESSMSQPLQAPTPHPVRPGARRRAFTVSALAVLTAGPLVCTPALAVEPGQPAPRFDLPAIRAGAGVYVPNTTVDLADYQGKTVYLDFWASWCGPCKQSFPWMNDMQARYGSKGLQVLAINLDQRATDARDFLIANPARFDVAFDAKGATPTLYGIKGMPTSVLIGPTGRVLWTHTGFRPDEKAELEQLIQKALKP